LPQQDLSDPTPWRHSLQASVSRRATALRQRRMSRSRRALAASLGGLALAAGGAFAADGPTTGGASPTTAPAPSSTTASPVAAAQAKLGLVADGVAGPQTRKAVRAFQRSSGLPVDGRLGTRTLAALGVTPSTTTRSAAPATAPSAQLTAIAQCESGGDPTAVSPSGQYRGKYQFSRATWRAMGGTGDPASAPEAEQDQRAAALLAEQGPSAWPVCAG
jgi:peptidoglycan hydrolase-like protein with peptidoglycan-binding domain